MRILIVDDSILVRGILRSLIESLDGFEVIGEASNGSKGVEAVSRLKPDLLIMDVNMPIMDGIEATEIIMRETPLPILIFTSEDILDVGYKALAKGALEVVPKPDIDKINSEEFKKDFTLILNNAVRFGQLRMGLLARAGGNETPSHSKQPVTSSCRLVAIGASTGGPTAVRTVLSALPANFPVPIIVSQHIEIGFDKGYAQWLNESTPLTVRLAENGDTLEKGLILVAPATHHIVCRGNAVYCDDGPRVDNQKPSVDKMFISASQNFGAGLLGVLLTGMGRDGARGCVEILKNGGHTLVQDENSSMIFGMPRAAIESKGASQVLALTAIAGELIRRTG
jgi:two-component system chemotaxis response regulator CheB